MTNEVYNQYIEQQQAEEYEKYVEQRLAEDEQQRRLVHHAFWYDEKDCRRSPTKAYENYRKNTEEVGRGQPWLDGGSY